MPWHPLHQAHRVDDDLLYLIDPWMGPWAIVRRLRFGHEVWYRATTFREDRRLRELIGYSRDLRALARHAYHHHLHRRSNTGPVNGWEFDGSVPPPPPKGSGPEADAGQS